MAEFAGYVGNSVPPIDWGKIGTDLYDKINKVNDERKAEKEKIEDDYNEAFTKIGDYEQTTDQSLNEMIYKGVDEVRNSMKTQYDLLKKGAITMADYKLYKNTAMTDWSTLNKAVKGYGNTIAGIQKLITEGKMSGLGQYNALTYAKLSNLKDAKIMVNPETGRIYRANINPKTGTINSESDIYSPSAMLNPGNLVDLKVDINDGVTTFLNRVAEYGLVTNLGGGKIKITEDARNNPAYQKALDAQINALTVTPRSTTSVLTDYVGDYQFFESEAQKRELIAKGMLEENLIKVERNNGVYEPIPTKTQESVAKEYVRNQIEVGVGQKESMTQGFAPQQPREPRSPKQPTERQEKDVEAIIQAQEAFESLRTLGEKSPYATLLLSSAVARNKDSGPLKIGLLKRATVNEKGGGRKELGSTGFILRDEAGNVVKDIQNAKDFYIFTNPGTAELESEATYNNVARKLGVQAETRGSYKVPRVSREGWK